MAPLRSTKLGRKKKASHAHLYALAPLANQEQKRGLFFKELKPIQTKLGAGLSPRASAQSTEAAI